VLSKLKFFFIFFLCFCLLASSVGCYKPAYLDKSENAEVSDRWKVKAIAPSRLSPDEKAVLETMGNPQYVRFFRRLSPNRERVYEWIYTDPLRFVSFIDGKKLDYVVVDDDLSFMDYQEKRKLLYAGIVTGAVLAVGLLSYYLFGRK
jgi:hypothetical protein